MLNNLKSTVKDTLIYSVGNLSTKLVGFILIPLYTTKLTTQEFGIYGILEATSQVIVALLGLGLYNAFYRWYWDKEYSEKKKSMFFTILVAVFVFSILFVWLLTRFSGSISSLLFDSNNFTSLVNLMLINTALEAVGIIPATLLRLQQKSLMYSVTYMIKFVTNLIFAVYFVKYLNLNIEGIYQALIIGNVVYLLVLSRFVFKNIEIKFEPVLLNGMLKFGIPLVFSSMIGVLFNMTDRFSLRFLKDLSDVGVFSLGFKIANTLKVFIVASINMALWPMIFKMMDKPENKRFYSKMLTYIAFSMAIMVLGMSFFGKEIIKLLAKQTAYYDSFKVIPIVSFSIFFGMLRDISFIGFHISKKTKIIATLMLISFFINVGFNVLLIPPFGIIGAAAATSVTQLIMFGVAYRYAQKQYFIPYEIVKVIKVLLVTLVLIIISYPVNNLDPLIRIIIKVLLLGSFPLILSIFNFYEKIELERISGAWRKWKNPLHWKKNLTELINQKDES
ncbi:MAG TPA: oligosaccharide flippase family protein [Bacteroidales bacterium]|nr:oligosaccharide flippase family protein [Bacteroidales bacterium]